ncbi:ATP11-domain-containing protein [Melanomma pulvis-pyrius CBS 109.77]|uniref:ATP11-domain-containing protein n=1 Tax=Melanomma pulvis-pyrius CBS 109.77 TaxID=1314802 RepID=A0A6A6WZA7_9PLEO|nr:ATP11-domain-containing protein [Melanomma pulvis-pyrius CBS 109.77]
MATHRLPTMRYLLRQPLANPRNTQRRWAQVQDVRFLATHGAQERVLAKYKHKLESKAKEHGLKDVSELKEAYKDRIERLRKEAAVPGATAPLTPPPTPSPTAPTPTSNSPWPSPPPPPAPQTASSPSPTTTSHNPPPPGVKTLHSFLDVPKVATLPQKELQTIWRLRHASNPQSLHFTLPTPTFDSLLRNAKKHPNFVLPLPRQVPVDAPNSTEPTTAQAAELHYLQFAHPHHQTTTLLFTTLAEFKLRGEFASPHTTITFHSELADSHGLVLGQGIIMENRGVSVDEARWLVMCMQKFYVVSEEGEGRGELLDMFTRGDGGFRIERLLEEAEKIV